MKYTDTSTKLNEAVFSSTTLKREPEPHEKKHLNLAMHPSAFLSTVSFSVIQFNLTCGENVFTHWLKGQRVSRQEIRSFLPGGIRFLVW